ncbi:MAG: hypothetical protein H6729_14145 [Deltaproteobacteria bacterium]|nr:hypothetical protein [Deltaproteobacteria bacterium]
MGNQSQLLRALQRRAVQSLLPGVLGGVVGYIYALNVLSDAQRQDGTFLGLYSATGAAMAILGVRIATIARMVLSEMLQRRKN